MGEPAQQITVRASQNGVSWPLRLAQQALAGALEGTPEAERFRRNAQHAGVRARLSALSADERHELESWLAAQRFSATTHQGAGWLGRLAQIDAGLAARIERMPQPAWARTAESIRHGDLPGTGRPPMLLPLFARSGCPT